MRKIVDSLLAPAANKVKSLGPYSTPRAYLDLLDSAYDIVKDGDELFAEFLIINQDSGEKPFSYLHRLQSTLNKVVKLKAIPSADSDKELLKQFCHGCWNNSLIMALQLEQKKDHPTIFAELLLLLRMEEHRRTVKASRMKQHLGFTKTRAQSQAHDAFLVEGTECDSLAPHATGFSAIKQIQKKLLTCKPRLQCFLTIKTRNLPK